MTKIIAFIVFFASLSVFANDDVSGMNDHIPNAFDGDKPSVSFLVSGYQWCMKASTELEHHTHGQAATECSCLGDYVFDHMKMSFSSEQAAEILRDGKKECEKYLSHVKIVETNGNYK